MSNTEHLSQLDSLGARHTPEESSDEQLAGSPVVRDTVLDGRYRLCEEIGRGGMGSVWRAERLGWQADVAVKLMTRTGPSKPGARRRFEREVRLAAQVRSPHVVQVLDHGVHTPSGTPFLVMELLEGESLSAHLRRTGRLSASLTFQLVVEVGRALSRAHAHGIIHRDLKPDNLFLVPNGDAVLTKVLDFGVAKWVGPNELDSFETRPGSVVGSPLYMSPEQLRSDGVVDGRTDLWSLAVIVCECLTGVRPFEAPDFASLAVLLCGNRKRGKASELGPVPPGFDRWFARATHTDPAKRFGTIAEFKDSLRKVCERAGDTPSSSRTAPNGGSSPRSWLRPSAGTDSLAPTLSESRVSSRATRSRTILAVAVGLSVAGASVLTVERLGSKGAGTEHSQQSTARLPASVAPALAASPAPVARGASAVDETASAPTQRATSTDEATPAVSGSTAAPTEPMVATPAPTTSAPPTASAALAPSTKTAVGTHPTPSKPRPRPRKKRPRKRPLSSPRGAEPAASNPGTSGDTATIVNGHRIRTLLHPTKP